MIRNVDVQTLKQWLDAGEAVLVDVRETGEAKEASIAGAALVPLSCFNPAEVPQAGGKKLVFHCKVGGRSMRVCQAWVQRYPQAEVWNLDGGMDAWAAAGLPVACG